MKKQTKFLIALIFILVIGLACLVVYWSQQKTIIQNSSNTNLAAEERQSSFPSPEDYKTPESLLDAYVPSEPFTEVSFAIFKNGKIQTLPSIAVKSNDVSGTHSFLHQEKLYLYVSYREDKRSHKEFIELDPTTGSQRTLYSSTGALNIGYSLVKDSDTLYFTEEVQSMRHVIALNLSDGSSKKLITVPRKDNEGYHTVRSVDLDSQGRLIIKKSTWINDGMFPDRETYLSHNLDSDSFTEIQYTEGPKKPGDIQCLHIGEGGEVVSGSVRIMDDKQNVSMIAENVMGPTQQRHCSYWPEANTVLLSVYEGGIYNSQSVLKEYSVDSGTEEALLTLGNFDYLLQSTNTDSLLHITSSGMDIYSLPAVQLKSQFPNPTVDEWRKYAKTPAIEYSEGLYSGLTRPPLTRVTLFEDRVETEEYTEFADYFIAEVLEGGDVLLISY